MFELPENKYGQVVPDSSEKHGEGKQGGERAYFIVRSLKDNEHEAKGFVLRSGHKVRFGRV
jgi:hypothetical protein